MSGTWMIVEEVERQTEVQLRLEDVNRDKVCYKYSPLAKAEAPA